MEIALILVPYTLGQPRVGLGLGPERLLDAGAVAALEADGHRPRVDPVELTGEPSNEIEASFVLARLVADRVRDAVARGTFPLVLAGNCNTALGTLAGLAPAPVGIVWCDAHADFETPETTPSGLFDGMVLAAATGACWQTLATGLPGFRPVPEERVLLVGARAIDGGELDRLRASRLALVTPEQIREDAVAVLAATFDSSSLVGDGVYLHLDLDVLDPNEGKANRWAEPGGPTLSELEGLIAAVGERAPIRAAALTAYDPTLDVDGRMATAGVRLLTSIARAAASRTTALT